MAHTAVGLLSGGLDSTLAARLIMDQGIEVHAVNFTSPFCTCTPRSAGCASVVTAVEQLGGIPLTRIALGREYLDMVQSPRHGYGRGMNPCIDCRILKLRRAADFMREIGASFLFTGEVLGQRPMSQHRRALEIIDAGSGLVGLVVRPLCAAHLEPTIPEVKGWVDRSRFLDLKGRGRRVQMDLAAQKGIGDYPCPAGGCLLTDTNFADRLREYMRRTEVPQLRDMPLLRVGRHFCLPTGDRVVVARDHHEAESLTSIVREGDTLLEPEGFSGPAVLLRGSDINAAISRLLEYTRHEIPPDGRIRIVADGKETFVDVRDVRRDRQATNAPA